MRAVFDDFPVGEHDDAVEARHRRQAMGDHDRGAAPHEVFQGLLDELLAFAVERARSLVEHEDGRVGQDGAGNRDALALTARKLHASLAGHRIEAFGEGLDEFGRVGLVGRPANLLHRGARLAVGDVFGDCAVEESRAPGAQ